MLWMHQVILSVLIPRYGAVNANISVDRSFKINHDLCHNEMCHTLFHSAALRWSRNIAQEINGEIRATS